MDWIMNPIQSGLDIGIDMIVSFINPQNPSGQILWGSIGLGYVIYMIVKAKRAAGASK